uniref:Uncharacterized protein n=1 Tax=Monopterus albus TaxID=43700 RepID=A0A3Q3ICV3_MONAL
RCKSSCHLHLSSTTNFLKEVELMAKFDPVMKQHVSRVESGAGSHVHYLGKTIQNELIDSISSKTIEHIVTEIKISKYFSIILDCTPDLCCLRGLCIALEQKFDGELVRTGNAVLKAEIMSADGSRAAETEITDNKNGTYEVGYMLRSEGEYSFALSLYGQPIRGSPFRLRAVKPSDVPQSPDDVKRRVKSPSGTGGHIRQKAVRRPSSMYSTTKKKENPIEDELIYRVGSRGREKGEFTNLQGISASSNGRVVVADSNNQCIQVFSNDGQFKMRFGVRGRSPGQLQRPTGVTVDMNGDIVVADYDNRWGSIFSSDGKFKNKIGAGRLMGPKGVAVDKNGHIITVDNKACCVFIFQSNGKLETKFGSRGTSDRQFAGEKEPTKDLFLLLQTWNRIQVRRAVRHSVDISTLGPEMYLFFEITNLNLMSAKNSNFCVLMFQVFDSTGSFLSYINTSADPLYGPQGLALTSDGHVAVADSGNHCFKVYRYLQ